MIKHVKYLKILLIILTVAAVACSPVRVRKSAGSKDQAKTTKTTAVKQQAVKQESRTAPDPADRVKTRFSDTTVIYLDKPPD